jgi:hypothetical protein
MTSFILVYVYLLYTLGTIGNITAIGKTMRHSSGWAVVYLWQRSSFSLSTLLAVLLWMSELGSIAYTIMTVNAIIRYTRGLVLFLTGIALTTVALVSCLAFV